MTGENDPDASINSGNSLGRDLGVGTESRHEQFRTWDVCDYGLCTRKTVAGSSFCEKHQRGGGVFDDFPSPSNTDTRVVRERVDSEVREQLTRVEAKLDALLAVLDVDVEDVQASTGDEGGDES